MPDRDLLLLADAFNRAWNEHDLDAALALVTDDCAFESTGPSPDGVRHEGRDAVRAAWRAIFDDRDARFVTEDCFVAGDRIVQTWRYDWGDGHVRGVDLLRLRDGLVCEKLTYAKG